MNRLEASTVIRRSPEAIYDLLVDFPRYAEYSKYLATVTQHGDCGAGTEYDLTFSWWRLSYTTRSRVTALDPPQRVEWRLLGTLDARGEWEVVELDDPPTGASAASRVYFRVRYNPDSADGAGIDLPAFVSLDWVIDRVAPKVQAEARRIVERVVADLEGEPRPVDLQIHDASL